jgi:hypothetical protein
MLGLAKNVLDDYPYLNNWGVGVGKEGTREFLYFYFLCIKIIA